MIDNDSILRSKQDLIERFINEYLPVLMQKEDITESFESFVKQEGKKVQTPCNRRKTR